MDITVVTTALTLAIEFITMELKRLEMYADSEPVYVIVDKKSGRPYFFDNTTNTGALSNGVHRAGFFSFELAKTRANKLSEAEVIPGMRYVKEAADHLEGLNRRMLAALVASKEL